MRLPGDVDSNSPVIWERVEGRDVVFALVSAAGMPKLAAAPRLDLLGFAAPRDLTIDPWPGEGIWMEAVIPDADGTWYGYYHNERVAQACGTHKTVPRIGAARSRDRGRTWEPLGIVLESPPAAVACTSPNHYFVGGVGDFSVQLDAESRDLYFFFSQYAPAPWLQGVAVARLAWADRDDPGGKAMVWGGRPWIPAAAASTEDGPGWRYPPAWPVFRALESWHDEDTAVDAFWGPSVHWNTHLEQYVMLLNRAKDTTWAQEGIYVSYSPTLVDPSQWSVPVKLMDGGPWYPQVIGIDYGVGTDRLAGQWARLFVGGSSRHYVRFSR